MNTQEYLDAVRAKLGLPSDYALQKPLGLSKQQLSRYRKGLDTLSDPVCLRIAEILQIPEGRVLLDAHIERSKAPDVRAAWESILEKISVGFEILIPRFHPRWS